MNGPKIFSWSKDSWNPVTGCKKMSEGCKYCYAMEYSHKHQEQGTTRYENGFDLTCHDDLLDKPYTWKKGRRIFTCSMSDLFQPEIPVEFVRRAFITMCDCRHHIFLVLTKRAEYLMELSPIIPWSDNIWMGVTVESDKYKHRIDILRETGAYHKLISVEPLLTDLGPLNLSEIDWVFVGGESGLLSRPMEEDWVLKIRDQCFDQDVMFTFKQWGGINRDNNGSLLQDRYYHDRPV